MTERLVPKLGDKACDIVSDVEGVVVAITQHLGGRVTVTLEAEGYDPGRTNRELWERTQREFDIDRVEVQQQGWCVPSHQMGEPEPDAGAAADPDGGCEATAETINRVLREARLSDVVSFSPSATATPPAAPPVPAPSGRAAPTVAEALLFLESGCQRVLEDFQRALGVSSTASVKGNWTAARSDPYFSKVALRVELQLTWLQASELKPQPQPQTQPADGPQ